MVLRSVYLNHGLTAIAAFLLAVPVFWLIIGPPYFFLAAVLVGIFQFIPLLGSSVLVAGLTAYFFIVGPCWKAWMCVFVAIPLVVGVPDLVIRPALARYHGRISPFTMLIGFLMGLEAYGLAGFVLGPLFLELFVCVTGIMLYGPTTNAHAGNVWFPCLTKAKDPSLEMPKS
jgi:predicted PurR-regulated permease PerM